MSEREHEFLLELMKKSKSMMIISGYDNDLYNDMLQGWAKSTRQTAASSQNGSATQWGFMDFAKLRTGTDWFI